MPEKYDNNKGDASFWIPDNKGIQNIMARYFDRSPTSGM